MPEHFSELRAPARTGAQAITGSITVHALYRSNNYMTAGTVTIDQDVEAQEYPIGEFRVGEAIPFALTLDAEGNGCAQLGLKAITFTLPGGQSTEAGISRSTGDVLFSGLSFGG